MKNNIVKGELTLEELILEDNVEEIIKRCEGLIYKVASRYKNDLYYEDMVLECRTVLYKSIYDYDSQRGMSFSSYAYERMWQESFKLMRKLKGFIRKKECISIDSKGKRKYKETYEAPNISSYNNTCSSEGSSVLEVFVAQDELGYMNFESRDWVEWVLDTASKIDLGKSKVDLVRVIELVLQGLSFISISKTIGISDVHIRRVVAKFREYCYNHKWMER